MVAITKFKDLGYVISDVDEATMISIYQALGTARDKVLEDIARTQRDGYSSLTSEDLSFLGMELHRVSNLMFQIGDAEGMPKLVG